MKKFLVVGICLLAPGCASVVDGTSQQIALNSNPPGAQCMMTRKGEIIGNTTTPGAVLIKKTKHDIEVSCSKPGYETSTAYLKSEIQDSTWGNIILGGGIGWAIDSASGADNKYQEHVTVTLNPDVEALRASILASQAQAVTTGDAATAAAPAVTTSETADVAPAETTVAEAASNESAANNAAETAPVDVAAEETMAETETTLPATAPDDATSMADETPTPEAEAAAE